MLLARHRPDLADEAAAAITDLAEGSIGRALELAGSGGIELYQTMLGLLARPRLDLLALHIFADRLARTDAEEAYRAVTELLGQHLGRQAVAAARSGRGVEAAGWASIRDDIGEEFARTDGLNLDRKQAILGAFFAIEKSMGEKAVGEQAAGDPR